MTDKLTSYRQTPTPADPTNQLWPLYGAGLENFGVDGKPIAAPLPAFGPDELLIRHDACGLCFSDVKVVNQGQNHPRIFRDMKTEPVVMGHEVAMTILGVGDNLKDRYHVGERLTLETDIIIRGNTYAYGYWFQGGLSQYSVIGPDIYAADNGNNLIKVQPKQDGTMPGYAEVALTEPWACVVAAYALKYRDGLKPGGALWVIGAGATDRPYTISRGFGPHINPHPGPLPMGEGERLPSPFEKGVGGEGASHPAKLYLTHVPAGFAEWLKRRAAVLGIEVTEVPDPAAPPFDFVDDIALLGADPALIELVSPRLDQFGVLAILADAALPRKVNVDVGRIHYHRWTYVGTTGNDLAAAYQPAIRSNLKPGGKAWFIGAGGPMGRMHVQRAIEFNDPPGTIVCTDVSDMRLSELCDSFSAQAEAKGINWLCLNPMNKAEYAAKMAEIGDFDDIVVLAPVAAIIAEAGDHLAPDGVMNIFAGVARGTMAALDLSGAYLHGTRVIGHSASLMSDFELVLSKTNSGELSPNRSVAAVGSLSAAYAGLQAVKDASFAGKVVIYPNIQEFPLTQLADLKDKLPSVHALLNERGEWTNAAEDEFLRLMLPDFRSL
jgi:D-arabinose 1-dehydrogenase-like Zn-dependent alcohol dehydrogenase